MYVYNFHSLYILICGSLETTNLRTEENVLSVRKSKCALDIEPNISHMCISVIEITKIHEDVKLSNDRFTVCNLKADLFYFRRGEK